jgi:hypothetical protein
MPSMLLDLVHTMILSFHNHLVLASKQACASFNYLSGGLDILPDLSVFFNYAFYI